MYTTLFIYNVYNYCVYYWNVYKLCPLVSGKLGLVWVASDKSILKWDDIIDGTWAFCTWNGGDEFAYSVFSEGLMSGEGEGMDILETDGGSTYAWDDE